MKKIFAMFLTLLMILTTLSFTSAECVTPQEGKKTKSDNNLTIDCSHMDQGYVLVKAAESKKRLKIVVQKEEYMLPYDLNQEGEYEVFPLQYGSGKYTFTLYENLSGKTYKRTGEIQLKVKLESEDAPFLCPNKYVDYGANTACVQEAETLCAGLSDETAKAKAICGFVKKMFGYDFLKASGVMQNNTKGMMPDIDNTWNRRMGVCQDLSAVTVAMLRSQGIPAKLMMGTLDGQYHAWVVLSLGGVEKRFDPTASLLGQKYTSKDYKVERYY